MNRFAVVDVETTGGSLEQGSRITEIAVVIHDGYTIHETFSSLVNPGIPIPPFISKLTGITDEMVATAPAFHEIAQQLSALFNETIFVAHNVSFDFSHVCSEFSRCGIDFTADKLCTYQASRAVFKGFGSYSLSALTKNLGIALNGHHRALNDARAASEILKLLVHHQGLSEVLMHRTPHEKKNYKAAELLNKLPETAGVYFFIDSNKEIFYVGMSKNIRKRVSRHLSLSKTGKSKKMQLMLDDICYFQTGCELLACMIESEEIKKYKPYFNRAGKNENSFCLTTSIKKNLPSYQITDIDSCTTQVFKLFRSQNAAEEFLEYHTDKFNLCRCLNGLDKFSESCFYTQIKKCNGVIQKKESEQEYLTRFNESVSALQTSEDDIMLLFENDFSSEEYVALVRYRKTIGYTFVPKKNIPHTEEIISHLTLLNSYTTASVFFDSFLKRKKYARIQPLS
ncbi:MAG: GIY-YIG nuclease family protein [Bacteroidetes bacterium]|jgi:DNA polymerase-3 subunit epsilon|nr:GIY-YIG nuclease family protein [Bacteroidota bacterium]